MQVIVTVDEELLERLQRLTGVADPGRLVDAGLRTLAARITLTRMARADIQREVEIERPPDDGGCEEGTARGSGAG